MADQGHKPAPARRRAVHRLGAYCWRVGIYRRSFLIGALYELQADCWMLHLGPFAVRFWRADR